MKKYHIFYSKDMSLTYLKTEITPEELPGLYAYITTKNSPDINDLFILMQGEVWSPNGEARELIGSCCRHTSMSVGDIVIEVIKGVPMEGAYMCASCSWVVLSQETKNKLTEMMQGLSVEEMNLRLPFMD